MKTIENVSAFGKLPPRDRDGHKGHYGRALVVGGSRRMVGAPALTANGALRGGAGLVVVAAPAGIQLGVATLCPCATSIPLPCDTTGSLVADAVPAVLQAAESNDLLAVGPGLAVGPTQQQLVQAVIGQDKPLVLDADGLNNLAAIPDWPSRRRCGMILTPHPGEFARLTGESIDELQADRAGAAQRAITGWLEAAETDAPLVLVLKGAGTVVTDGESIYVNDTGNPGMATGGAGDVLTGLLAGLAMQGPTLFQAAGLGVWAHGRAGDLAAAELTETALTAEDILEYLAPALSPLCESA